MSSLLRIFCLYSEAVDGGLAHPTAQCEDGASSCAAGNLQTPRQVINVDCNYLLSINTCVKIWRMLSAECGARGNQGACCLVEDKLRAGGRAQRGSFLGGETASSGNSGVGRIEQRLSGLGKKIAYGSRRNCHKLGPRCKTPWFKVYSLPVLEARSLAVSPKPLGEDPSLPLSFPGDSRHPWLVAASLQSLPSSSQGFSPVFLWVKSPSIFLL